MLMVQTINMGYRCLFLATSIMLRAILQVEGQITERTSVAKLLIFPAELLGLAADCWSHF